ncbi:MAG TPA: hypothetical protein VF167_15605 [Longimicrobiaceae bacterium]
MCILCDHGSLELLTTSLESLSPGRLSEAVRAAREAAGPGVMDHAEAVLRGDAEPTAEASLYDEIVARALESGVLSSAAASDWGARIEAGEALRDPRVQAYLSSCAEILDEYLVLLQERRQVVERFVEAPEGRVSFLGLGPDGELWFDFDGESYVALSAEEAKEIVQRELGATLHTLDASVLMRYSSLPESAGDVVAGILAKPTDVANGILGGIIDLPLLAEDRIRAVGYAPFFRGDPPRPAEDLRFGEWIIVRIPSQV